MDNRLSEKSIQRERERERSGNEVPINPLIQLPIFILILQKKWHFTVLMPLPPLQRDHANKFKNLSLHKFSVV